MCCIRVKTIELLKLLDIVGFIVGMFYGYCLWAQVIVLLMLLSYWIYVVSDDAGPKRPLFTQFSCI